MDEQPGFVVEGERVALGPLRMDLVATYQRWENDLEAANANGVVIPFTLEAMRERIAGRNGKPDLCDFTVYDRSDQAPIGWTSLGRIDHRNGTADFGILLGERRDRGLGTEATRLTLDWGFTVLGLHNVMLGVAAWNQRAIRVYSKVGFREVGRRRSAGVTMGRRYDAVYMDLLASEFLQAGGSVLAGRAARLAHLVPPHPPGRGGTRPLPLAVRLDAVAAVLLDGLSYRRAGRMVGISKPRWATAWTCCLARLATSASASPTARSSPASTTCARCWPRWPEPARRCAWTGWPPGCSDPGNGGNQKVLYDAKRWSLPAGTQASKAERTRQAGVPAWSPGASDGEGLLGGRRRRWVAVTIPAAVVIAIVGTVVARHPQPPAAGTVTATIKVGSGPFGVATDTHAVWVVNKDSGTVSRIDR